MVIAMPRHAVGQDALITAIARMAVEHPGDLDAISSETIILCQLSYADDESDTPPKRREGPQRHQPKPGSAPELTRFRPIRAGRAVAIQYAQEAALVAELELQHRPFLPHQADQYAVA